MLKKTIAAVVLVFVLLSVGCSQKKDDYLAFQKDGFETEATMDVNGERYTVSIKKKNRGVYRLEFTSPEAISGVVIEKNGDKVTYSVGSVHIPIEEKSNAVALAFGLLDLREKDLVSATADDIGGVKVNRMVFENASGSSELCVSTESGLPLLIEAELYGNSIRLSFSSFTVISESSI